MKNWLYAIVATTLSVSFAHGKIVMEKVDYRQSETQLQGFITYDTSLAKGRKKLPGVVVVHDWTGVGDYVKTRSEQLAKLGYVAFVADIYGVANQPKDQKAAATIAGTFRSGDRKLLRSRAEAAYTELKKHKLVDNQKISAIGYCFGGTTVLEMARAGLPLKGVVSLHGGLSAANMDDASNIKSAVLVLHGAIDPFVPAEEVANFQKEMNTAQVDYQFVAYSDAVHSFTQKQAGDDASKGSAYNQKADERSFVAMKNFLTEVNK